LSNRLPTLTVEIMLLYLLETFFKGPSDGHAFADGFHATANVPRDVIEFAQIPSRNLGDNVVQTRFKARRRAFGDGILNFRQRCTESNFCRDKCQRVPGRLGRERTTISKSTEINSYLDRDRRAFISMTAYSIEFGFSAYWTLHSPTTPT
jgi:hypothetical protein